MQLSAPALALALALALAARASAAAAVAVADAAVADDGQWTLVFEDTFSAPQLNASVWRVADNFTHGGQEWELYTAEDVYVEGGSLVLRTQARDVLHGGRTYHFTSGWVDTLGKLELGYGKFEARIRLPAELPGLWPA